MAYEILVSVKVFLSPGRISYFKTRIPLFWTRISYLTVKTVPVCAKVQISGGDKNSARHESTKNYLSHLLLYQEK